MLQRDLLHPSSVQTIYLPVHQTVWLDVSENCTLHFYWSTSISVSVYVQETLLLTVYNNALHCNVCFHTRKSKNNMKCLLLKGGNFYGFQT